jgi:hypothetical protein
MMRTETQPVTFDTWNVFMDDRFCDNSRQRINCGVSCFARQDLKSFALPVRDGRLAKNRLNCSRIP